MPDIDVLRELTGQLRAPGFDDLVAVSRRRRRRAAAGAAAAVAVVVLAVGGVVLALPGGTDAPAPAPQPSSPSGTPTGEDRKLERVRAAGYVGGQEFTPDGSLMATKYVVCKRCNGDGPGIVQVAIEVTDGDASALFEGRDDVRLVLLDEHTVLVQDSANQTAPVRYRLLRADGTEVELRWVDDPAPAVPDAGVFIDDYASWRTGTIGPQSLALVDEEAGTVQPVMAPADVKYWGPNTDEAIWGVTYDCRARWAVDGSFQESDAGCSRPRPYSYVDAASFPAGWLEPGRMVVAEAGRGGRVLLHVTLDGGATWQLYPARDPRFVTATLRDIG